jgi:hypothetical protein
LHDLIPRWVRQERSGSWLLAHGLPQCTDEDLGVVDGEERLLQLTPTMPMSEVANSMIAARWWSTFGDSTGRS